MPRSPSATPAAMAARTRPTSGPAGREVDAGARVRVEEQRREEDEVGELLDPGPRTPRPTASRARARTRRRSARDRGGGGRGWTRRARPRPDRPAMLHFTPHSATHVPKETPVTIHFVVHEEGDSVGTIVVEGVKAGDALTGWIMEQDKTVNVKTLQRHPDRPQDRAEGAEERRHRHQVRRRHRAHDRADQAGRVPARAQREDQEVVSMAIDLGKATFRGYRRDNGRVGVRNHVIILPVDDISNAAAEGVARNIKGTMALPHPYGRLQFGADLDAALPHAASAAGSNPNVAGGRRDRHRAGLDEARRRRHRERRQAGRGLRDRAQRRSRHDHERVEEGEGVRAATRRRSIAPRRR